MDDSLFGCDYNSNGGVTATGDIGIIEGLANAKQSIRNQILTKKGAYPSVDDEYGSEVYEILGEDFEGASVEALQIYIRNALLENERVKEIIRVDPLVTVDKRLVMMIDIELVNGTEEVLNVEFGGIE